MDSHTHSSVSQCILRQRPHVGLLSRNGLLSVGYVGDSRLSCNGSNFLGTDRPSDPRDCFGRYHRQEACLCLSTLRLSDSTGFSFSRLLRFAHGRGLLDRESYIAQYIALALFTVGATNSLGNDDLLAAFAAGVLVRHYGIFPCSSLLIGSAISWDGHFNLQTEDDAFSSILDLVLNCACFIYIGAWLPFNRFEISELGITPWRLVMLMLIILALRRIPSLLILYKLMPEVSNWREALFCGHFGPVSSLRVDLSHYSLDSLIQIGVGAVFISTLAQSNLDAPQNPPSSQQDLLATALQPIVSFVVLGSILTRMSARLHL